jgi:hypothetical protein
LHTDANGHFFDVSHLHLSSHNNLQNTLQVYQTLSPRTQLAISSGYVLVFNQTKTTRLV